MKEKEIISIKSLRKFDIICLHDNSLRSNKLLQQKLIDWASDMLTDAREEWNEIRATTIEAIIKDDRKNQARKRSKARDEKYAPFREYFKKIQIQRFNKCKKSGKKLTANSFVAWFLQNEPDKSSIPYRESNLENKLKQLAQANNREFEMISNTKAHLKL